MNPMYLVLATLSPVCPAVHSLAVSPSPSSSGPTRIEWRPVDGATGYVATLRETVPNGPRIQTSQRVLQAPALQVLPGSDAALTKFHVAVVSRCADGSQGSAARTEFVVDRRAACGTPASLRTERRSDALRLAWTPVPGATAYRVAAYRPGESARRWQAETGSTQMTLHGTGLDTEAALLWQVQALCGRVAGAPAQWLQPAP